MKNRVAERKLLFATKGSDVRKELVIRIGTPYLIEEGMVKCPVEWDGLFEDFADIYGIDSIQAINLASNVEPLLEKLQKKYDFYWASGEPYFEE